jgi:hypothetical protein
LVIRLVGFALLDQPRLHKSPEEPLPHLYRVRVQGRQDLREVVHGQIDSFREFHERERVPRVRRLGAGLGKCFVEVRQQFGRDLPAFDGFRDAPQESGLEGFRYIGGVKLAR